MTEEVAMNLAAALSGDAWQSGGGIWIVIKKRDDGRLVAISDEAVCEYEDEGAFERSETWNSILLV